LFTRGSVLKATSRSQPVSSSCAFCSALSASISSRMLGNHVGMRRHMVLLMAVAAVMLVRVLVVGGRQISSSSSSSRGVICATETPNARCFWRV
jgi:hypothetical protein